MPIDESAQKLLDFLAERKDSISPLLILTHDFPDPDALASAYALQLLSMQKFGIKSRIEYSGVIGRMENRMMVRWLHLPVKKLNRKNLEKTTHVALVDTQPEFNNNSFPPSKHATLVVDQHDSDKAPDAECAIIDRLCGATSAILARALLMARVEITPRVATSIIYGILTDTMSFFHSRRNDLIQTYIDILPFCDMGLLAKIQNPPQPNTFFKLLSKGIESARVRGKVVVSHLGEVRDPDSIARLADLLLSCKAANIAMCTGRYRGTLRISLRVGKHGIGASGILSDIVERGEAGGHDTIAGGSFKVGAGASDGEWVGIEEELVHRLFRRLKIPYGEFYKPFA
jgi:nanoRNase/pAp phosphatase (c-di-AMP/oligoRNAs hydrolase)